VNHAALPVESHTERIARLAEAASWNHGLVLVGTAAAWVPVGLIRPRPALAGLLSVAGIAMCSHGGIFKWMVDACSG
jgi:hypothetical protein